MRWLENAIAAISPQAAARRAIARRTFDAINGDHRRGYAAADTGRHLGGWISGSQSADSEIGAKGAILRDRSRDMVRDNPHAAKAVSVLVSNIIGDGIWPRANSGSKSLDRRADELFEEWSSSCDAEGMQDFAGVQALAVREMIEAGDVFIRRRARSSRDPLPVPLQVQILEADFLDTTARDRCVQGIEFDGIGRRRGYWLYRDHPGSTSASRFLSAAGNESRFVPASEIVHMYEMQRTQVRGVPWGTPSMVMSKDLDDYEVAEIRRKQMESCLAAVVTSDDDADAALTAGTAGAVRDSHGRIVEQFEPGMIAYARAGKTVSFNNPAAVNGYPGYKVSKLHDIATGWRVPYELLTGDLSQVNFSSSRVGLIEFRRMVQAVQWQIVIQRALQPMWQWFVDAAYLSGKLPRQDIKVQWSPPKFQSVDPYKDAMADLIAIRAGTKTLFDAIAEHGINPQSHIAEIKRSNDLLDELEIVLDSDPRRVARSGAASGVMLGEQQQQGDGEVDGV